VDRALASGAGERTIHLAAEPGCSSLFPAERVVLEQVADLRVIMAQVGTTTTGTTTLDRWCEETGWGPIDFLKADVQGAELEVLMGAASTLSNVVVMELEVEFNSLYAGQPLFADIDALARSMGFSLWRLSNLVHYTRDGSPRHPAIADVHFCDSRPVGWGSPGGQLFWAHATYLSDDVIEGSGHDWQRPLRAGCVAAALGLHDLALHAWMGAARLAPEPSAAEIVIVTEDYGKAIA
jgi:FkbM family methyltransferase